MYIFNQFRSDSGEASFQGTSLACRVAHIVVVCSNALSAAQCLFQRSKRRLCTARSAIRSALSSRALRSTCLKTAASSPTQQPAAMAHFSFRCRSPSRYSVRVAALSFQTTTTPAAYFSDSSKVELDVTLATATLTQQITVTATGTPMPEAQTGASVTVIPAEDYRYMPEAQDPLRLVPGLQVTQIGQMGGTSGLSIRGGSTDANKVLIDGVPANAIGGGWSLRILQPSASTPSKCCASPTARCTDRTPSPAS